MGRKQKQLSKPRSKHAMVAIAKKAGPHKNRADKVCGKCSNVGVILAFNPSTKQIEMMQCNMCHSQQENNDE